MLNDVLDLDAGFYDNDLLTEQMRWLSGLLVGGAKLDERRVPARWVGHEDALTLQLNLLMAEMRLRRIPTPEPLKTTAESILWPVQPAMPLSEQFALLSRRAADGKTGRIALPKGVHDLWACFKYSVLARNHQAYTRFGQRIATRAITFEVLLEEMVGACRVAPRAGGMRNAVQHMWGYVSRFSTRDPNQAAPADLLAEVQFHAMTNDVTYLRNSTALGELSAWLAIS